MTTPIVMLVLLMTPYAVARLLSVARRRRFDTRAAGAIGLGILFVFTASGHFIQTEPMAQMLPSWVPQRVALVYLTGVLELAVAVGFFVPKYRPAAGWAAAAMLVLFFPANVYAAIHHVPLGGHAWGPVYLLVRAPLQIVILWWIYWFTIRQPNKPLRANALSAVR
jgi:uncharacterized membrane protein